MYFSMMLIKNGEACLRGFMEWTCVYSRNSTFELRIYLRIATVIARADMECDASAIG